MPYKLTQIRDGKLVLVGVTEVEFQGNKYVITYATPPHREGTAGKVCIALKDAWTDFNEGLVVRELYATTVGLQWIWIDEQRKNSNHGWINGPENDI